MFNNASIISQWGFNIDIQYCSNNISMGFQYWHSTQFQHYVNGVSILAFNIFQQCLNRFSILTFNTSSTVLQWAFNIGIQHGFNNPSMTSQIETTQWCFNKMSRANFQHLSTISSIMFQQSLNVLSMLFVDIDQWLFNNISTIFLERKGTILGDTTENKQLLWFKATIL